MTTPLMVGRGIKIFRWERELLILTDEIPDSFKIDGGMRAGCGMKRTITCYRRYPKNREAGSAETFRLGQDWGMRDWKKSNVGPL